MWRSGKKSGEVELIRIVNQRKFLNYKKSPTYYGREKINDFKGDR